MAKGSRGGQRGISASATLSNLNQSQQQTASNATPQTDIEATPLSKSYEEFVKLTPDEQADVIESVLNKGLPAHLADTALQRFIYHTGMNDVPDVVSDAQLDKLNGTELYRTVNEFNDGRNRMKWTAKDVAEQLLYGDTTRIGAGGGTAFGEGLYFANNFRHSQSNYGYHNNDAMKTQTIRGKLNANANPIDYYQLRQETRNEINSGSKLGKALQKADYDSREALYALAKGHSVTYDNNSGYFVVFNRRALTFSNTTKAKEGKSQWN